MADENPTDGGRMAPLDLRPQHIAILRRTLSDCLEGVRADLRTPERMRDPVSAAREAGAYERLLCALDRGQVSVPDEAAREAVAIIAAQWDRENNYEAVVAEHDALHGLLASLSRDEGT
jgi:hypothetical protein